MPHDTKEKEEPEEVPQEEPVPAAPEEDAPAQDVQEEPAAEVQAVPAGLEGEAPPGQDVVEIPLVSLKEQTELEADPETEEKTSEDKTSEESTSEEESSEKIEGIAYDETLPELPPWQPWSTLMHLSPYAFIRGHLNCMETVDVPLESSRDPVLTGMLGVRLSYSNSLFHCRERAEDRD